jgi:hypothetical protein
MSVDAVKVFPCTPTQFFYFFYYLIFYRPGNTFFEPYLVYKTLKYGCFAFLCVLGEFGDKSMEAIVLAETDEVAKTTIKISTSSALRKRLFHLFFILFVDVDIYDTKLHQFYTIISRLNAICSQIK